MEHKLVKDKILQNKVIEINDVGFICIAQYLRQNILKAVGYMHPEAVPIGFSNQPHPSPH
jgi:hypothetical protein